MKWRRTTGSRSLMRGMIPEAASLQRRPGADPEQRRLFPAGGHRKPHDNVPSPSRMPRPFAPPGTRTNFLADRPVHLEHVRLEWELDLARKRLSGTATLTMTARRDGVAAINLDAVEL